MHQPGFHISALYPLGFHTSGVLWDGQPFFFLFNLMAGIAPSPGNYHLFFCSTVIFTDIFLLHHGSSNQ